MFEFIKNMFAKNKKEDTGCCGGCSQENIQENSCCSDEDCSQEESSCCGDCCGCDCSED